MIQALVMMWGLMFASNYPHPARPQSCVVAMQRAHSVYSAHDVVGDPHSCFIGNGGASFLGIPSIDNSSEIAVSAAISAGP